jgi:hypothetical protein
MTCSEKSKMSRRIRIEELDQAMLKAQFHHEAKQSKMRIAQFEHERKRLESIIQMGLDPVLDALV